MQTLEQLQQKLDVIRNEIVNKIKPPKIKSKEQKNKITDPNSFMYIQPMLIRSNNVMSAPFLPRLAKRAVSVQKNNQDKPIPPSKKFLRSEKHLHTIFQFYAKKNIHGNDKKLVTFDSMLQNSKQINL